MFTLSSMVASLTANRASGKAKSKGGRPKKEDGKSKIKACADKKKSDDDIKKTKRPWKETALRKGWLEFRAEYMRQHKQTGKNFQELNKDAGEAWGT